MKKNKTTLLTICIILLIINTYSAENMLNTWEFDAQKGLAEYASQTSTQSATRITTNYSDNITQLIFESQGKQVADITKIGDNKINQYIKGSIEIGYPNPMDNIGQHQLLKMYKVKSASNIITEIGTETIQNTAILKKGIHYGPNEGFGWEHIIGEGHNEQIKTALNLSDSDSAVKDVIEEVIESGTAIEQIPGESTELLKTVTRGNETHDILVIISDNIANRGSLQTAYPFS